MPRGRSSLITHTRLSIFFFFWVQGNKIRKDRPHRKGGSPICFEAIEVICPLNFPDARFAARWAHRLPFSKKTVSNVAHTHGGDSHQIHLRSTPYGEHVHIRSRVVSLAKTCCGPKWDPSLLVWCCCIVLLPASVFPFTVNEAHRLQQRQQATFANQPIRHELFGAHDRAIIRGSG